MISIKFKYFSFSIFLLLNALLSSCQPKESGILIELELNKTTDTSLYLKTAKILRSRLSSIYDIEDVLLTRNDNHITIKIPSQNDSQLIRDYLFKKGNFEIVETFEVREFDQFLKSINSKLTLRNNFGLFKTDTTRIDKVNPLSTLLDPQWFPMSIPVIGYSFRKDTSIVNTIFRQPEIDSLLPGDFDYRWEKDDEVKKDAFKFIVIKKPHNYKVLSRDMISVAKALESKNMDGELTITLKKEYIGFWETMTFKNIGRKLVILMDDQVISIPQVHGVISDGVNSVAPIKLKKAKLLASILNNEMIPLDVKISKIELVK